MRSRAALVWLLLVFAVGCTDEPSDETPSGSLRLFLDAMERSQRDPSALRDAYRQLAAPTRRALAERARMAGSLGGREFHPWEMIAPGRYRQSFTPAEGSRGMRESIDGTEATVTVSDEDGTHRAEVPLVLEDGHWRIVLELPPVRGEAPP